MLVGLLVVGALALWVRNWLAVDQCLDSGGRWNSRLHECEPDVIRDAHGAIVPSATEVQRLIKAKGERAALSDLYADEDRWDAVLDEMAKGEQDWLELVETFYNVAGEGSALDLGSVAAEALATEPKRVLEVLEPSMGLEILCDNDFSVGVDYRVAIEKIGARRTAVKGVTDANLSEKRLRCLAMLDTLEADVTAAKERGDIQ